MFFALTRAMIRGLGLQNYSPDAEASGGLPVFNTRGEMLMNQVLPERTEVNRQGFTVAKLTDAVAAVTAIPTTTAPHTLWNGEGAGGKSYILDRITWQCTTSAVAASNFSAAIMLNKAVSTAAPATADTAVTFSTTNGKSYTGRAVTSHTVTVTNDIFVPIGASKETALTATVGQSLDIAVNGLIIIPPGFLFSLAIVAVNVTALGKACFFWHEAVISNVI